MYPFFGLEYLPFYFKKNWTPFPQDNFLSLVREGIEMFSLGHLYFDLLFKKVLSPQIYFLSSGGVSKLMVLEFRNYYLAPRWNTSWDSIHILPGWKNASPLEPLYDSRVNPEGISIWLSILTHRAIIWLELDSLLDAGLQKLKKTR